MTTQKRSNLIASLILLAFSLIQFAVVTKYMKSTYLYGKDTSWHLVNACLFSETLENWPGLFQAHRTLVSHRVTYPPLVYLVSVIPQWIAGDHGFRTILGTMAFFLFVLNLSTYYLVRRLADTKAAIWAVLFLAAAPGLLVQLAVFNLTLPLAAMTVLGLLALEGTRSFLDRRGSILFGAVAGLAMITYIYFAFFLLVPVLYMAIRGVKESAHRSTALLNLALASFVALLISSPYFLGPQFSYWTRVTGYHLFGSPEVDAVAETVPTVPFFGIFWFYLKGIFDRLLGPALAVAACLGLVGLLLRRHPKALYLTLCLFGPLVLHSLLSNAYTERLLPLAPVACLTLAVAVSTLERTGQRIIASLLILALAAPFAWHRVTYDRNALENLPTLRFEDHIRILSEKIGDREAVIGTMYPKLLEYFSYRPEYSSLRLLEVHTAGTLDFYVRFANMDFLLVDFNFEKQFQNPEPIRRTLIHRWNWMAPRADRVLDDLLHIERTHDLLLRTENLGSGISLYMRR